MAHLYAITRRTLVAAGMLGMFAVLASCHHNDDDDKPPPPVAGTPGTPPPVATDAFITAVSQVVATQNDTDEPVSTDGYTATAPEGTEPVPQPGS